MALYANPDHARVIHFTIKVYPQPVDKYVPLCKRYALKNAAYPYTKDVFSTKGDKSSASEDKSDP